MEEWLSETENIVTKLISTFSPGNNSEISFGVVFTITKAFPAQIIL